MTSPLTFTNRREISDRFNPEYLLSYLWRIPQHSEMEPGKVEIALRERIKELNCLYGIARLAEYCHDSMNDFLKYLVDFLPLSWQYPEIACARIIFEDRTYRSKNFKLARWRLLSRILVYNEPVGEVAVFYSEERPAADEGPFLKEERVLIDEVSRRIGAVAVRVASEKELQEINRQLSLERTALQEANATLRTVLAKIEEQKQQIYKDMQANIEKVIMPILNVLALEVPQAQRKYVEILKNSLDEITSPFINRFLYRFQSLTPTEISICNLIRNGMQNKEIAELRGVSIATITRHREHIRRKLKITNSNINLTTYLQSFV